MVAHLNFGPFNHLILIKSRLIFKQPPIHQNLVSLDSQFLRQTHSIVHRDLCRYGIDFSALTAALEIAPLWRQVLLSHPHHPRPMQEPFDVGEILQSPPRPALLEILEPNFRSPPHRGLLLLGPILRPPDFVVTSI